MRAIGLRAAPKQVTYSILEEQEGGIHILDVSRVTVPGALQKPDQFRYLRTTFLDIINEYQVSRAGLRLAEGSAANVDLFRVSIEAILQELLASSPVEKYFCGRLNTIASYIGEDIRSMRPLIDGEQTFNEVESWAKMKPEARESFLTAVAALSLDR